MAMGIPQGEQSRESPALGTYELGRRKVFGAFSADGAELTGSCQVYGPRAAIAHHGCFEFGVADGCGDRPRAIATKSPHLHGRGALKQRESDRIGDRESPAAASSTQAEPPYAEEAYNRILRDTFIRPSSRGSEVFYLEFLMLCHMPVTCLPAGLGLCLLCT